jgi:hypothetical protein
MKILQRQDGSISRTKSLNAVGLVLAVIGAVLPVFQVYVSPEIYSIVLAVWGVINQRLRTTQDRL